jgi:phosphatidylserine decarboxylase
MSKFPIRKESLPYILVLAAITLISFFFFPLAAIIPFIMLLFIIYFFRDPKREVPLGEDTFLSPADGTVMEVKDVDDDTFINGKAKKISIFLSVFNVHINRSPISGKVAFTSYRPGKYLPAFKSHASELNERNTIGIENEKTKVIIHQITGILARRIVCWSQKGDTLEQGEKFGLIKFGSCTEIIVPYDVEVQVQKGDIVRGGITVIGVIK